MNAIKVYEDACRKADNSEITLGEFEKMIEPLMDVEPVKHGRWVPGREIGREMLADETIAVIYEDYKCSSCGLILFRLLYNLDGTPFYKFCPNCGASMRGRKEE